MAAIHVDPKKVHEFTDEQRFYDWLARHHDTEDEVWIKLHKVGSGLASITPKQAIDVVLCWGWSMTAHGLREVQAAQADGRWERAYGSGKGMPIPDDLQAAIDAEPQARKMLGTLSAQNRFALAFRVHHMKTEAGRKKKIASLVDMLKRGEAPHPQKK